MPTFRTLAILVALSGCQAGNTNPVTLDAAPVFDGPTQNSSIVRVLTHNIGPWADARETALALFASEEFDIIALQEVTRNTDATSSLLAQNPALSYEDNGTTNPIFWRTSVFSWDSRDTGIIEWSVPDEAIGGNRTANWVRLHHLASDRDLLVVSTQLLSLAGQVENAEALNAEMAKSLGDEVAALATPDEAIVVMGDMNQRQDSPALQYLLGTGELEGESPRLDLDDVEGENKQGQPSIDYILVRADASVIDCSVVHTSTGSQHQAQSATLELLGSGSSDGSCP